MYRVNKSSPHRGSAPLARPSVAATPGNRLISIRDLDCPADRVSRQSDLLFQPTRRASAELSGVSNPPPATIPGTLLSSFFIHPPPAALARPRPRPTVTFFAWPLADNKMATDRDERLPPSKIVRISSRRRQIDRAIGDGVRRERTGEALLVILQRRREVVPTNT